MVVALLGMPHTLSGICRVRCSATPGNSNKPHAGLPWVGNGRRRSRRRAPRVHAVSPPEQRQQQQQVLPQQLLADNPLDTSRQRQLAKAELQTVEATTAAAAEPAALGGAAPTGTLPLPHAVGTLAVLLAGFAGISYDVGAPSSLHLLAAADAACHSWVVAHTPATKSTFAWVMSNGPVAACNAAWALCTVAALARDPARDGARAGLAWFVYWAAGGSVAHGDPWLVHGLKEAFHRARPSTLHSTYSFPSGHTTSAFFLWGALLLVLLPAALHTPPAAPSAAASAAEAIPVAGNSSEVKQAASMEQRRWLSWPSPVLPLWLAAGCTVGAGRVLVDAHWLSDVLAGACLGGSLALGLYVAAELAERAADTLVASLVTSSAIAEEELVREEAVKEEEGGKRAMARGVKAADVVAPIVGQAEKGRVAR